MIDLGPGAGHPRRWDRRLGNRRPKWPPARSRSRAYLRERLDIPISPEARRGPVRTGRSRCAEQARTTSRRSSVKFPLGTFTGVTGVSGAGKSTPGRRDPDPAPGASRRTGSGCSRVPRAHRSMRGLEHLDKVIDIDQSPIGRTPRSNPATYTSSSIRSATVRDSQSGEDPRLQARPLLVQRDGRSMRNVQG